MVSAKRQRKAEPSLHVAFSKVPWATRLSSAPRRTPVTPDTDISAMLQKEGFLALTPSGGHVARAARLPGTAGRHGEATVLLVTTPSPPASQPGTVTTVTGTHEQGWWSDLDSARADLTPPRHLQSLSGKAEVTEETQGIAGYF